MSVSIKTGSVVAQPGQAVSLSSLFTGTEDGPTYLVVQLLDRNEYTAAGNGNLGTLSGNGHTAHFAGIGGDSRGIGIVFTYNAQTGQYTNATYGNLASLAYTASTNPDDNTSLSLFGTDYGGLASQYADNPGVLAANPAYFTYDGSVSVVTQPGVAQPQANATPDAVCSAAVSFVGQAWNENGCWVLASNISAIAGASLPLTSTFLGMSAETNGEWIVAYNGPGGQTGDWQSHVTAGEMVVFQTSATSGHITTVVSGSGSTAELVDNAVFVNANGTIANAANDGSAADITIAGPHLATQEFAQAMAGSVVVYELDTPVVTASSDLLLDDKTSIALSALFTASDPANRTIAEYQIYNASADALGGFSIGGSTVAANSAAGAITIDAAALSSANFVAGDQLGIDTIDVRAFNGSYWGDWQAINLDVTNAPVVANQTPTQLWYQNLATSFTLPANTFVAPEGETLSYSASLDGAQLPSWLQFSNGTFSGAVPHGITSFTLSVTATDSDGGSATDSFDVTAPVRVTTPTILHQTANQTVKAGQAVNLSVANVFSDPHGAAQTFAVSETDGSALPSWLSFDAASRSFSGTVPTGAGGFSLRVTATDVSNAQESATENFTVAIKSSPAAASSKIASMFGEAIAAFTGDTAPAALALTQPPPEQQTLLAANTH
jgi:hypothetical protein